MKQKRICLVGSWAMVLTSALNAMPANADFASVPLDANQMAAGDAAAPTPQGPETVNGADKIGVQGNWVKKREWLIKAHEANAEIQEIAVQAESIRKSFIEKFNTIDAELDEYYKQLGLGQGKVQELFDGIMRYLEKKKTSSLIALGIAPGQKPDREAQAKSEAIENTLKISRQQLDQLKLDMKSVEDLAQSLIDRLNKLDEHLHTIQEDATRARSVANELWSIIDHNKARDRYYEIKLSILEKIKNVQAYLGADLSQDFDAVMATIQTQKTKTLEQVKKLEEEGFFIKNRAERVKEAKAKDLTTKQQQDLERVLLEKQRQAAAAQKKPAPRTWYQSIYDMFIGLIARVFQGIGSLKNMIVGAPAPTPQTVSVQPVAPASQPIAPTMPVAPGAPALPTIPTAPTIPPAQ